MMEKKEKTRDAIYKNSDIKDIAIFANSVEEVFKNIEKIDPGVIKSEIDAYNKAVELLTEGKAIL